MGVNGNFLRVSVLPTMFFLATGYPRLVTQRVRTDFEGMLLLIECVNNLLNSGFHVGGIGESHGQDLEVAGLPVSHHLHHFPGIGGIRSLRGVLTDQQYPMESFAFGNVIGLSIPNASSDTVAKAIQHCRHQNFEFWMKELLGENLVSSVYEAYVDSRSLRNDEFGFPLGISMILTSFLCMILCSDDEFNEFVERSSDFDLRRLPNADVLVGKESATNFVDPHFQGISINPIIIRVQSGPSVDHRHIDAINSILNTVIAVGELYNLYAVAMDLVVMIGVAMPEVNEELSRLTRSRNPLDPKYVMGLFGTRELHHYHSLFAKSLGGPIRNIRLYRTESARVLWEQEGIYHYNVVGELLELLEAYSIHVYTFLQPTLKPKWIDELRLAFYGQGGLFDTLKEPVNNVTETILRSLNHARTALSLNVAVAALVWTVITAVFSPLPTPALFSVLNVVVQRPESWLAAAGLIFLYWAKVLGGAKTYLTHRIATWAE